MTTTLVQKLAGTSPSAAGTAILARTRYALHGFDCLTVHASLVGATGGTLDVYLQSSPDGVTWFDWHHFTQLAAGAAATNVVFAATRPAALAQVTAIGRDASPALAAGTVLGTDWGVAMRLLVVAGSNTSAGAALTVFLTASRLAESE